MPTPAADDGPPVRLVQAPNPSPMTGTGTNTWLVGLGSVTVIDPGPALPGHLATILAALAPGEHIGQILVTHAHADHSALAPALARATGAPVKAFGPASAGRSPWPEGMGGGEGVDHGFTPDVTLADGDRIGSGDWPLRVLHTPGHMGGHLCFAAGTWLFTGDHVMGWAPSLVSPPDGDMGDYMASLARLAEGHWTRFLPGHGATVDDPAARLAALIAHRRAREAAILAALDDGPLTLPALVARVYADTAPALHPAAARNALAHLADLARRGRITATPAPLPHATFALTPPAR